MPAGDWGPCPRCGTDKALSSQCYVCGFPGPDKRGKTLAAIRAAAGPLPPADIRWHPRARTAVEFPALAPFCIESPERAAARELHERMLQEYISLLPLLTPHPNVGNVRSAGGVP